MRFKGLVACFLLLAAQSAGAEECWVTWDCNRAGGGVRQCASIYGGRVSGRNGPFASCSGWQQRDRLSACTCSAAGQSPAGGSGSNSQPAAAFVEAVFRGNAQAAQFAGAMWGAQLLGAGLGQALRGDPQAAARARAAEEARLMQEAALRHERERRFVENKNNLLQQMDGGMPGGRMGFKDDDEPVRKIAMAPEPEPEIAAAEPSPKPECKQNWESAVDAMSAQEQTLREAGADRADLLMAIPQGHFEEGLGHATTAGVGWLNKELPKVTGPKDAPRGGWLEATGAGHTLDHHFDVKSGVRDARIKKAWLKFMADIHVCAEGKGGDLAACVRSAGQKNDMLMGSVNVIGGIESEMELTSRVDAAGKAINKYAAKYRDLAMSNISKAANAMGGGCQ